MSINIGLYRSGSRLDGSQPLGGSQTADGLVYAGAFRVPQGQFGGTSFSSNPFVNAQYQVMAFNPTSDSMFLGGFPAGSGSDSKTIGEITIPALVISENINDLNTASVLQNPIDPSGGEFDALKSDGSIPSAEARGILGGIHVYNGKLMGTAWSYYDASASNGDRSHWTCDLDLTNFSGLHIVGTPVTNVNANGGYVGGYITEIPEPYATSLGYNIASGRVGGPIVSRSSIGPSLWGFDPSTFNFGTPATAKAFLTYPEPSILGGYSDTPSLYYNRGTGIKGAVWHDDSVWFFGNHGLGIEMNPDGTPASSTQPSGYGYGTSNKTEAKTAAEIVSGGVPHRCGFHTISVGEAEQGIACVYDPIDSSLGTHNYEFEFGAGHSLYGFGTSDWTQARTSAWLQANSPTGYQCGVTSMTEASIAAGDACNFVGAGSSAKGGSSYPSLYQVWKYSAQDILDVNSGAKAYNEIIPEVFNFDLPFIDPTKRKQLAATAYDASKKRVFILQSFGDGNYPVIHAFDIG